MAWLTAAAVWLARNGPTSAFPVARRPFVFLRRSHTAATERVVKSCLGLLLSLLILAAVLATGAGIWYFSHSTEFARKDKPVIQE